MPIASSDRDKLLVREQACQLFQNAPSSTATQIIVVVLFYTLFDAHLSHELLLLWCTTLSALAISRLILVWFYNKKEPIDVEKWLNGFTFLTLLMGVTWACFSLFYLTIGDVGLKYLLFVIICGVVAGAVIILAAWTPAYYANTLPQLISWPTILVYSNSTTNDFLAISFIIYCVMLIKLHSSANHNIRLAFELQHKNDDLVAELNAEIESREQIIERRTQELNHSLIEKTAIANNKLVGIAIVHERKIQWANSTFETMLGYNEGELVGCLTHQFYANETDFQAIGEAYQTIADGVIKDELEFKRKDGMHVWFSVKGSILDVEKGQSLWMFVDISERKKASEKLRLSSRVFSHTHDGIIITDANQSIIDVNPAFCNITGYSHEEVIGKNPSIISSGKQSPQFYNEMWQTINEQGHWQGEVWNRRKSGEVYAELLTISELKDSNGKISNFVGVFSDITKSKQHQEKLKLLAHYDVLTNLPNRTLFTDRFHQAIAHSKRSETLLAVCFLDLDNFKPINDNFGHEVGDELLIEVGHRITACIREEDTVARLGGDEFAILLGDILSYKQCTQTMKRIHHSVAEPYWIDGVSHEVTASSGIALYPLEEGDVDTLLRYADQAMYLAKQAGRNRYQLFDTEQEHKVSEKNHRLAEISSALTNNEFELYYQPKVNMVTGDIFGAEALIRWNHPKKGLVPPLDFLPIMDDTDLEIKLGEWVINTALAQLESWLNQGLGLEVSINISAHHLLSETFFDQLGHSLAKHPVVDSELLQLEILENSVLGDIKAITDIIERCQNLLGVNFALDDFGTGYSSLTHLRNLPVCTVKIDQTFIRDMLDDPNDYAIIDGVIGLTDSFGRHVIAEGVETTEHGLMLLLLGCEQAQGYGLAKPMPVEEFVRWMADYTPNNEWLLCGNQQRSKKENERKLFRLTTMHWKNKFVENILLDTDTPSNWPIMDDTHCPCGFWLQRAKRAQIFDNKDLKRLKQAHDKLHIIANSLFSHYQKSDLDIARNGLGELQAAFDDMNDVLMSCK